MNVIGSISCRYTALILLGLGCSPPAEGPTAPDNDAGPDVAADGPLDLMAPLDTAPEAAAGEAAFDGGPDLIARREQVCARWRADRADRAEGTFTGNADQCLPGDITAPGRANALKVLNLYRFIADMAPVPSDATLDAKAQSCALMMHANGVLNHTPPTTWKCYDATGAEAAARSNLAHVPAVEAIDQYMNDFGNETTLGHRRWILANRLRWVGIGSAPNGSCLWVIDGNGTELKPWRAWPAPGPFPFEATNNGGIGLPLDVTGWSVQSDVIDLRTATVTVTDGGQHRPVVVNRLESHAGSRTAIRFVTSGWVSEVGHTYRVEVGGVTPPIAYDVEMVACSSP